MCRPFNLTESQFEQAWESLSETDRRFISTLSHLNEVIGDDKLRYRELPIEMQQFIAAADRDTCFSLLAESLAALLNTSVMNRVKRRHSRRRSRRHSRNGSKDTGTGDSKADALNDARYNERNDHNKQREPS